MRRVLILFLCLLLPLQGFAAWQAQPPPCPMEGMMAMAETADSVSTTVAGDANDTLANTAADTKADCCNDPATFALSGQPCKNLKSCFAPTAGLPPLLSIELHAQFVQSIKAALPRPLPPGVTSRLWRPPTSI